MGRHSTEVKLTPTPDDPTIANYHGEPSVPSGNAAKFSFALNPVGPTEEFLVEELARRATQARYYDAVLADLEREGEAALMSVMRSADEDSVSTRKLARASVLVSERHQALSRQSMAAARGFMKTLHMLRDTRKLRYEPEMGNLLLPDPRYSTEQACLAHLVRRFRHGISGCHRCGAAAMGSFVAVRNCWQCARCHAQTGVRLGTCMEDSAIPLAKWFACIRIVLLSTTIPTAEIAAILKIKRGQTVRKMIKRIHAALRAPNPSAALAGLDEIYLGMN